MHFSTVDFSIGLPVGTFLARSVELELTSKEDSEEQSFLCQVLSPVILPHRTCQVEKVLFLNNII